MERNYLGEHRRWEGRGEGGGGEDVEKLRGRTSTLPSGEVVSVLVEEESVCVCVYLKGGSNL